MDAWDNFARSWTAARQAYPTRSKQDETGGRGRADKTHHSVPRVFHDRAVWRTSLAMLVTKPAVARDGPERG
jgi:hypothetical protein